MYFHLPSYRYAQKDGSETTDPSAEIELEIVIQDLPSNITIDNPIIGQPLDLEVQMKVFPHPNEGDYNWWVVDKNSKAKDEVHKILGMLHC